LVRKGVKRRMKQKKRGEGRRRKTKLKALGKKMLEARKMTGGTQRGNGWREAGGTITY